ncbi:MAG: hypothetical protein HYY50_01285 [Candidatus Kerfeldbacteria bacterium]|nr:hypothetical protein [Candidatus Kerfeldbacteria bacterium]
MHFRLVISTVLAIVVLAAGLVYWQTRTTTPTTTSTTNRTASDEYQPDVAALSPVSQAVIEFEAEDAVVEQFDGTLADLASDETSASTDTASLDADLESLSTLEGMVAGQADDDNTLDESLAATADLGN